MLLNAGVIPYMQLAKQQTDFLPDSSQIPRHFQILRTHIHLNFYCKFAMNQCTMMQTVQCVTSPVANVQLNYLKTHHLHSL